MGEAPAGRPIVNFAKFFPKWFASGLISLIHFLVPEFFKRLIIRWNYGSKLSDGVFRGILAILNPKVFECFMRMGMNEMDEVQELNSASTIEENVEKLTFYYGANDRWTPKSYFDVIKTRFPLHDFRMDTEGIEHAFVLFSAEEMAFILSDIMKTLQ